ncbi:MAG: hypothetical protein IPL52_10710 [Flavobacteriales bacterium]|nr:hypothetical protein [Flavobacteriales bacterium]
MITESEHLIGTGSTSDGALLSAASGTNRGQYLFMAGELQGAGLQAGLINQLGLSVLSPGDGTLSRLVVRMKQTTAASISSLDNNALVTVYDQVDNDLLQTSGPQRLVFRTPFTWTEPRTYSLTLPRRWWAPLTRSWSLLMRLPEWR